MSNQVWASSDVKILETVGENLWNISGGVYSAGSLSVPVVANLAFTVNTVSDTSNFTATSPTFTINKAGIYSANLSPIIESSNVTENISYAVSAYITRAGPGINFYLGNAGSGSAYKTAGEKSQGQPTCSFVHALTPGDTITFVYRNYGAAATISGGVLSFARIL